MGFSDLCELVGAAHFYMPTLIVGVQSIQELSKSIYIPRGINTDALDRNLNWDFTPTNFKVRTCSN
jgi:hypothetical protein